jgi:hypothetical protein
MRDSDKTKAQLIEELSTVRRRLAELQIFKDYRKLAEEARRRAYGDWNTVSPSALRNWCKPIKS